MRLVADDRTTMLACVRRLCPPPALRQRIRWFFLADSVWGLGASLALVAGGPWDQGQASRACAVIALVALAASHIWGYRRGALPRFEFVFEGIVIGLAGSQFADVHQLTPLIYPPLFFRALYGSTREI